MGYPHPLPHPSLESATYTRMKWFIRGSKGLSGFIRETNDLSFKLIYIELQYHKYGTMSRKIGEFGEKVAREGVPKWEGAS
jgi:hypothetical protein